MSIIRKIAIDSLSYGSITILARIVNYAMIIFHVRWMNADEYGIMSTFYSAVALLNIIYIFGLETSFFRFIDHDVEKDKTKIGNMQCLILVWSLLLSGGLALFDERIAAVFKDARYAQYVDYMAIILFFDAISSIPFVKLRHQGRSKKYIYLKALSIGINIGLQFILIYVAKGYAGYDLSAIQVVFLANAGSSFIIFLLLLKEMSFTYKIQLAFIGTVLTYSIPLTFSGIAGMVNDMADRLMIPYLVSSDLKEGQAQNGIYAANYKISILILLFTQAYRLGAEPFFFRLFKTESQPQQTYAKLMRIYVICAAAVVLSITLFLPIWKFWIASKKYPAYEEGLFIIPILVFANLILGVYFNLGIWFKLTNKTIWGLITSAIAALITIVGNYLFLPIYGYAAAAWITLISYIVMAAIAFFIGKKYYPIPYDMRGILFYIGLACLFSLCKIWIDKTYSIFSSIFISVLIGIALFLLFLYIVCKKEKLSYKSIAIYLKGRQV